MKAILLAALVLGAGDADRPTPDAGPPLPSGTREASTPPITDAPGALEAPGSNALTPRKAKPLPAELDDKTNTPLPPAPDKTTAPPPPQGGGAKRTGDIAPGPNGPPAKTVTPPAGLDPDPRRTP
jgi:hypothetical protein